MYLEQQQTPFVSNLEHLNNFSSKFTFTSQMLQEFKRQMLISNQHGVRENKLHFLSVTKSVPCCRPPPILPPCCNPILCSHAAAKTVKLQHHTNTAGGCR